MCFQWKNNIGLKRVAVGAMGLLQNGLDFKFRGGCDALGPEVLLFLMFFCRKTYTHDELTLLLSVVTELCANYFHARKTVF